MCVYIYIYICIYVYVYVYILARKFGADRATLVGGWLGSSMGNSLVALPRPI